MKDWKEFRSGEVCEVTSSKRVFLSDYVKEGVPFYRSKEGYRLFRFDAGLEAVRNWSYIHH